MGESDVKYCVSSFTDLLGFSSHLEVGNDLRTKIGQGVIDRLNILEKSIKLFLEEQENHTAYYPKNIKFKRVNDAVIFTMDLPEYLTPKVVETRKSGDKISLAELQKYFGDTKAANFEEFQEEMHIKDTECILELSQFVGLVSRVHSFINRKESEGYFPGAKTVISSGFRRSYKTLIVQEEEDDAFSANFSFSNAYLAEEKLKGRGFFIDNTILELLGKNQFSKNIIKLSALFSVELVFDPFDNVEISGEQQHMVKYRKGEEFEVTLFRKKYLFREINSKWLGFIHLFPTFLPYLREELPLPEPEIKTPICRRIYNSFSKSIDTEDIVSGKERSFLFKFDIEDNIEKVKHQILNDTYDTYDGTFKND